jgi:hypothetical protein
LDLCRRHSVNKYLEVLNDLGFLHDTGGKLMDHCLALTSEASAIYKVL